MKTPGTWNFRSIFGKIMMGIVLTAMVGSIDVVPAFSRDDYRRTGKHDNGRYDNRGRGYDRNRHVQRRQPRRVYRPYGYGERVYVPPRVIFAPPPPPGISIFFPPLFIRP